MCCRMGASRSSAPAPTDPEVYGNVTVTGAELKGTAVGGEEIPNLIDELPLVAVLGVLRRARPSSATPANCA